MEKKRNVEISKQNMRRFYQSITSTPADFEPLTILSIDQKLTQPNLDLYACF